MTSTAKKKKASTAVVSRKHVAGFAALLDRKREEIAKLLPGDVDLDRFIKVAQIALVRNPNLAADDVSHDSLYAACLDAAQAGLMPDGRQSAIIAYWNPRRKIKEAQWQPMVEGILDRIQRLPAVAKVEARAVRQGDDFEFSYGTRGDLSHRPSTSPSDAPFDPTVSHAYAIVWWADGTPPTYEVVDRVEVEKARSASRASDSGAWREWYGEMARKVAVKRLAKYLDLDARTAAAIAKDNLIGAADREPEPVSVLMGTMDFEAEVARRTAEATEDLSRRLRESEASRDVAPAQIPADTQAASGDPETDKYEGMSVEQLRDATVRLKERRGWPQMRLDRIARTALFGRSDGDEVFTLGDWSGLSAGEAQTVARAVAGLAASEETTAAT